MAYHKVDPGGICIQPAEATSQGAAVFRLNLCCRDELFYCEYDSTIYPFHLRRPFGCLRALWSLWRGRHFRPELMEREFRINRARMGGWLNAYRQLRKFKKDNSK